MKTTLDEDGTPNYDGISEEEATVIMTIMKRAKRAERTLFKVNLQMKLLAEMDLPDSPEKRARSEVLELLLDELNSTKDETEPHDKPQEHKRPLPEVQSPTDETT